MSLLPLRERVAIALYNNVKNGPSEPWDRLPDWRKEPWLGDAELVIPIVAAAAARVATQRDPEKPANFLFKREQIGNAIEGLLIGHPADEADEVDGTGSDYPLA